MPGQDEQRKEELISVALKAAAVVLGIGLIVGVGSWLLVSFLGLNSASTSAGQPDPVVPVQPLPTTALPVPSESAPPGPGGGIFTTPPAMSAQGLYLSATPLTVQPMERINLTGHWAGRDNLSLEVQRLENGQWSNFGVSASVRVGTFATYVMTGRHGDQRFRMFDPASHTASNPVTVTVQ